MWHCHRSTDKRYARDNRLIEPKSSYRRLGLAPRCRLITSWGWRRSQGSGCSPGKVVRELGSERRETGRAPSAAGAGRGGRGARVCGGRGGREVGSGRRETVRSLSAVGARRIEGFKP